MVRLADNNVVGGLNIDGTGANFGIFGQGIEGGEFNGNMISGATLDGIGLQNIRGDFSFSDNMINNNLRDGIFINGAFDPNSQFVFEGNDVSDNGVDGIHLLNWDAELVRIANNTTSNNGRHGIFLQNSLNSDLTGNDVDIIGHTSDSNGGDGIHIDGGTGNLRIVNPTLTNNSGAGLTIRNWADTLPGDSTFVGGFGEGAVARFTGNGVGVSLEIEGAGIVQDVLFTQSIVDDNGRGLLASVDGLGSVMNLGVIDNESFNNNANEGIRLSVDGSGR